MPQVSREDRDLISEVTVSVKVDDYKAAFEKELRDYGSKVQLRGFRKGKTPVNAVRKRFGKAILSELIQNQINEALFKHLEDEKIDFFAQPIPVANQELLDFDTRDLQDYSITFEIGRQPEIELGDTLEKLSVEESVAEATTEQIDKEIERIKTSHTEQEEGDAVEAGDVMHLKAVELDGDAAKEDGINMTIQALVNDIPNEDLKAAFMGTKTGETVKGKLTQLEEAEESFIRKQILGLADDDERDISGDFNFTIEKTTRPKVQELTEAFLAEQFGPDRFADEDELRQFIKGEIDKQYENEGRKLLEMQVQDLLIEQIEFDLPDSFLKRYLIVNNDDINEGNVDQQYPRFAYGLRWNYLRNQISKKLELELSEEDVRNAMRQQYINMFRQYGGGMENAQMMGMIDGMVNRQMGDQEAVQRAAEEAMDSKTMDAIIEQASIKRETVSIDAFEALVKTRNEAMAERLGINNTNEEEE